MKNRLIKVPLIQTKKGIIGYIEKKIPFKIKRVFFKYNFTESGGHANLKTKMLIICIKGKISVLIKSKNLRLRKYKLKSPNKAIFIKNNEWRTIIPEDKKTIILVLASEKYSKNDY